MRKTKKSMKVSGLEIMERKNRKKFPGLIEDAEKLTDKTAVEIYQTYVSRMEENILRKRKFRVVLDNETIVGKNIRGPLLLNGKNIRIDHCKIRGDIFINGRKISITDCKVRNGSTCNFPFVALTPGSADIYVYRNEFTHESLKTNGS